MFLSRPRLTFLWLALTAATLTSASISTTSSKLAALLILAIAFAKAATILHSFMNLRRAPLWLRTLASAWLTLAFTTLATLAWRA